MSDGRSSAYYSNTVDRFLSADANQVLGALAAAHAFALDPEQRDAWEEEIRTLSVALQGLSGSVYLEFDVPRLGSRIDVVLVSGPAIFPIEFKCGERQYHIADRNQAWDYGLDLKNFHRASHDASIFPVLVATEALESDSDWKAPHADDVRGAAQVQCGGSCTGHPRSTGVGPRTGTGRGRMGQRAVPPDAHHHRGGAGALLEAFSEGDLAQRSRRTESCGHFGCGRGNHRAGLYAAGESHHLRHRSPGRRQNAGRAEHRHRRYHSFRGKRWENIDKEDRKRYLLNAYRVLLTRARQEMIIFVSPGNPDDPTRQPSFYDETYDYLASVGMSLV
jgi:schlafen family protein